MGEAERHTDNVAALWRALAVALAILLVLVAAHDVDHVVNEARLGELDAGFWAFLPFQYGAFVAVLVLTVRRHSQAPTLAAVLAAIAVLTFLVAHVLPFGPLPYADADPLAISWALVFVPMAMAAAAFVLALRLRLAASAGRRDPEPAR